MIAGLKGRLEAISGEWAVIDVNGLHFQVYAPTSTLGALGEVGGEVRVYTHLHVREDNIALYGFATPEELGLFQTVLGVSGLGPRLALAMLSALSADKLVAAIAGGNAALLTAVPGIGKKVAERIILELKDKIAMGWVSAAAPPQDSADVLAALISLGYSAAEAGHAAAASAPDAEASLEERVKLALQYLGGNK